MKYPIFLLLCAALLFHLVPAFGQPVAKADVLALLREMPTPASTLTDAFQRTYPNGTAPADPKQYYQTSLGRLEQLQLEVQRLSMQFYQKHPTGIPDMPKSPANRVSAKDKSAMEAATTELAQKMLTDQAFAQKFAQMSASEQQAYLAQALADKGIKPANGTPNAPESPMPGMDMDWATLCQTYMGVALDPNRWEKQTALQQEYAAQHDAVDTWVETEIKKLPMLSFGEYGHGHDPAQVKAIQRQGLDKHAAIADTMMQAAAILLAEYREQAQQRNQPLNDALKTVRFGETYSFGLHYTLVLQTQTMLLGDLQHLLNNEISLQETVAQWAYQQRNFENNR